MKRFLSALVLLATSAASSAYAVCDDLGEYNQSLNSAYRQKLVCTIESLTGNVGRGNIVSALVTCEITFIEASHRALDNISCPDDRTCRDGVCVCSEVTCPIGQRQDPVGCACMDPPTCGSIMQCVPGAFCCPATQAFPDTCCPDGFICNLANNPTDVPCILH